MQLIHVIALAAIAIVGAAPAPNPAGDADLNGAVQWADAGLVQSLRYGTATAADVSPLAIGDGDPAPDLADLLRLGQAVAQTRVWCLPTGRFSVSPAADRSVDSSFVFFWMNSSVTSSAPGAAKTLGLWMTMTTIQDQTAAYTLTPRRVEAGDAVWTRLTPISVQTTPRDVRVDWSVVVACSDGTSPVEDAFGTTWVTIDPPVCGNGDMQPGEWCDDGDTLPCSGCAADCTADEPVCGNGTIECGEVCDDGMMNGLSNQCNPTCDLVCSGACPHWYVDDDADGAGTGLNWSDAFTTVQAGIDAASGGEQVWVAQGTYSGAGGGTPVAAMKNGVALHGGFVGNEDELDNRGDPALAPSVLDGTGDSYHVVVGATDAVLDGFTITGGNARGSWPTDRGGGMFNGEVRRLRVENCIFTANHSAYEGGAINNYRSFAEFRNVAIIDNTAATSGAGMFNAYHSRPLLEDVRFAGNAAAWYGGGMASFVETRPTLRRVEFVGNSAGYGGGAMLNDWLSEPLLENVLIAANEAPMGGGIFHSRQGEMTLLNVTFADNSASTQGGAIYSTSPGTILTDSGIFWANTAPADPGFSLQSGGLQADWSLIEGGWPGTGNQDLDPQFVDPLGENYRLDSLSPAIDAGNPDPARNDPDATRNDQGAWGGPSATW